MKEAFDLMKQKIMQDRRIGRSSLEAFLEILKEVEAEFAPDTNVGSNGWIPVESGKMPKADERVLCLHDDGFIDCGELVGESWCCDMDEYAIDRTYVVAWHPLPEAYRRENE